MATAISGKRGRKHTGCEVCGKDHAPWFATSKRRWILSVGKKQINLGPDHDEAVAQWHRIEAGLVTIEPTTAVVITAQGDAIIIGELAEAFLANIKAKISEKRYKTTARFINRFVDGFGGYPVANLRVGGVPRIERWLDDQKTWVGCRPDAVSRIRQLFNWATTQGYLSSSPVKALPKGKYGQRVTFFTPEQEAAIFKGANPHFVRGFRMLILTGCRPDEICSLTAADVHDDASGFYLLVEHKNQKHTGKKRRVFLVPEAATIVREALKKYPKGRLFRSGNKTSDGIPPELSPEYFNNALRELCDNSAECEKLGLNDYETVGGKRQFRYVPYTARHTFAVRYLTGFYKDAKGQPIRLDYHEVAVLMGNSAKMIETHYGHLCDQTQFLTDRLSGLI